MKGKKQKRAREWLTEENAPIGWELLSESWYDWEIVDRRSYATWADENGVLVLVPAREVSIVPGWIERQYCFEAAKSKHLTYKLQELEEAGLEVAGLEWWVRR